MPSYKVMANVRVSKNLEFIVTAQDEDAAHRKIEELIQELYLNLRVEKMHGSNFDGEKTEYFDNMEIEEDEDIRDIQDIEELDED